MREDRLVRVLVVDDSAFMRKVIQDIVSAAPGLKAVGTARNGTDAIKKASLLKPQVITMDVEMPGMDGLEALQAIMRESPTAIIMVSSLTPSGAETTLQCLAAGAVDFIQKPSGSISLDMEIVGAELVEKIRLASRAKFHVPHAGLQAPSTETCPIAPRKKPLRGGPFDLLVIATSTGGPRALQEVIPKLPADFPAPVAVVQHMPKGFTASLAQRLDHLSPLTVVEGREGLPLCPGMVVIAPGDHHLLLRPHGGRIRCALSQTPPVHSVRPAADPLFESVALLPDVHPVGVILTGMGKDGTEGAKALKTRGTIMLGESPETAVVYGMPRSAHEAGVIDQLLPLHQIAPELIRLFCEGHTCSRSNG